MESTSYVLSFRMVFFYLVATGWILYISLYENSINLIKCRAQKDDFGDDYCSDYYLVVTTMWGHQAKSTARTKISSCNA